MVCVRTPMCVGRAVVAEREKKRGNYHILKGNPKPPPPERGRERGRERERERKREGGSNKTAPQPEPHRGLGYCK